MLLSHKAYEALVSAWDFLKDLAVGLLASAPFLFVLYLAFCDIRANW